MNNSGLPPLNIKSFDYRKEIDGLRSIAVISVILFHFFPEFLPGGYLGVDIFFTISGYIITATTINKALSGDHSILRFYRRRINRLIPSLSLVILTSIVFFSFFFTTPDFIKLINSGISSSLYVSNWYFLNNTGYFDSSSYLKPLLHTWSLSIEEQFYIVFPLVFLPLISKGKIRTASTIISVVTLLSLSYAIFLSTMTAGESLYFSTTTRAWQIGVGSLLALYIHCYKNKEICLNSTLELVFFTTSFGFYMYSIFVFDSEYNIPSLYSFIPLILPLQIIFIYNSKQSIVKRALSNSIMSFTGKISYQLYLWHWPVVVATTVLTIKGIGYNILAIFGVFILSWVTYYMLSLLSKKAIFVFSVASVFVVSVLFVGFYTFPSFEIARSNYLFGVNASTIMSVNTQKDEYEEFIESIAYPDSKYDKTVCSNDNLKTRVDFEQCFESNRENKNVLVIGDSTGRDTWLALNMAFPDANFVLFHQSSCTPATYSFMYNTTYGTKYKNCFPNMDEILETADNTMRFDTIILAFRFFPEHWEFFTNKIPKMRKLNKEVVVLGVAPILTDHFHRYLGRLSLLGENANIPDQFSNDGTGLSYWDTKKIAKKTKIMSTEAGAKFVDIGDFFCSETGCRLWVSRDYNQAMYWDSSHLTLSALDDFQLYLKSKLADEFQLKQADD
tara:strand:+ start:6722 stop:8737 length:2016 start_codon:yes stop_codon:yes gene_type:complete